MCLNYRACALEPVLHNKRSHRNERAVPACSSEDLAQSKKNNKQKKKDFRQHIKKQRHYFANKGLSTQGYGFSSSHVWM